MKYLILFIIAISFLSCNNEVKCKNKNYNFAFDVHTIKEDKKIHLNGHNCINTCCIKTF